MKGLKELNLRESRLKNSSWAADASIPTQTFHVLPPTLAFWWWWTGMTTSKGRVNATEAMLTETGGQTHTSQVYEVARMVMLFTMMVA